MLTKTDITVVPEYYLKYIQLAPDIPLIDALPEGGIKLYMDHALYLEKIGDKVYAPGKWTVRQIVEHLMDTERIFMNRALRFARNDKTELPGFDENQYVAAARSNEISLKNLLLQFITIRSATLATYANFNREELLRTGFANDQEISVLALGYIQVGHAIHHFNVIKERYFPLIEQ
ncbi:DinB family protein [Paracrocinitomix mangrovi]|uniref:DinB family protein n=1 Tax=Paracrocinitomix mangrovi TaxID=2862509 RepID=UPI001C8CF6B1|nr:DinB family protein [Paracrocinitomix mangrovi]UKN01321.1 DinB family protein [Paracrocinitomix mangrovi]